MDAVLSAARQARTQHRYELRSLTYVTLDQANGGIVRNLTHDGIGAQMVAALRPQQQVRVRFELRYPRLRIDTRGEVMWSTVSGQCGIRFLDRPPRLTRQINEWIFGNLLKGAAPRWERSGAVSGESSSGEFSLGQFSLGEVKSTGSLFKPSSSLSAPLCAAAEEDDGLIISAAPLKVIELSARSEVQPAYAGANELEASAGQSSLGKSSLRRSSLGRPMELDWLSRPLSGQSLVWTINALVVVAALLLFALVFLSVTREPPKWPLAMSAGAAFFVGALYWGFFKIFGGSSPGKRLVRLAGCNPEDDANADDTRFR
jgi:hypothetical protein